MIIKELDFQKTCDACPEQYDVYYNDKQVGYVRLRHGYLYAEYPDVGGKEIYEAYPEGDGMFHSNKERMYHLKQIAKKIWDEIEKEEEDSDNVVSIKNFQFELMNDEYPEIYYVYDEDDTTVGHVCVESGVVTARYPHMDGRMIYSASIRDMGSFHNEKEKMFHLNAIANHIHAVIRGDDGWEDEEND